MGFPERLKKLRQALGLSQKELAERLGLHIMTISRYERGKINPSFKFIELLKEKFKVNPQWLLSGEGQMFLEPSTVVRNDVVKVYDIKHLPLEEIMEDLAEKALMEVLQENREELKGECLLREELTQYAQQKLKTNYEALKSELLLQIRTFRLLWKKEEDEETS